MISGLWHGANWTFVVWGAYHAILFLPLLLMEKNRKHKNVVAANCIFPSLKEFVQIMFTFLLVVIGWIIFRSQSIDSALDCIQRIFTDNPLVGLGILKGKLIYLTPLFIIEWITRKEEHGLCFNNISIVSKCKSLRWSIYTILFIVVLLFSGKQDQFIYFQFWFFLWDFLLKKYYCFLLLYAAF